VPDVLTTTAYRVALAAYHDASPIGPPPVDHDSGVAIVYTNGAPSARRVAREILVAASADSIDTLTVTLEPYHCPHRTTTHRVVVNL
jgi:hypothetical protein